MSQQNQSRSRRGADFRQRYLAETDVSRYNAQMTSPESLEAGRIRKQIEDRKLARELGIALEDLT